MSRRDPESSLELLLDTMCNIFGGVMFIAISLLVLISMLSSQKLAEITPENTEKLRQEAAQMQEVLEKETKHLLELRETLAAREKDPRLKAVSELLLAKEQRKLAEIRFALLEQQNIPVRRKRDELKAREEELERRSASLSAAHLKDAAAVAAQKEEIEQIRREIQAMVPPEMTFRIMETRPEMPYFILLSGTKAWRVGPDHSAAGKLTTADDCTETVTETETGEEERVCTGKPERGTVVLDASGALTGEMKQILHQLPPGRGLKFFLHASAVPSFIALRKYLKEKGIFHGVSPEFRQGDSCLYILTKKARPYEY